MNRCCDSAFPTPTGRSDRRSSLMPITYPTTNPAKPTIALLNLTMGRAYHTLLAKRTAHGLPFGLRLESLMEITQELEDHPWKRVLAIGRTDRLLAVA